MMMAQASSERNSLYSVYLFFLRYVEEGELSIIEIGTDRKHAEKKAQELLAHGAIQVEIWRGAMDGVALDVLSPGHPLCSKPAPMIRRVG